MMEISDGIALTYALALMGCMLIAALGKKNWRLAAMASPTLFTVFSEARFLLTAFVSSAVLTVAPFFVALLVGAAWHIVH